MIFLLVASYPDSIIDFRGAFISALQAEGYSVHVAVPDVGGRSTLRRDLEAMGVVIHNIDLRRAGTKVGEDILSFFQLFFLMRKIKPDFVLGYTIKPVIYGSISAWLSRVPRRFALITGLGYAFQNSDGCGFRRNLLRLLVQFLYKTALRTTHSIFFQNPDDQKVFRSLGLIKSDVSSFVVNGSGVNLGHYSVAALPDSPKFLLIARLNGEKGVREYIEAARTVRARFPSAVFRLVGWIDENPDAISKQELDSWCDEGVVEFLGKLVDVRPAIADASIYVLPSYREGTPRTVLEAMAMGRPIITTDAPGCRETVLDGYNGFLVTVRSVENLERAMIRFIEEPGLIRVMGERSRRMAEEKYDDRKVNAAMLRGMGIVGD